VKANPHVLLAYAWVFYMALFSGGRLIRTSLQAAGPEFWTRLVHRDIDNNKLADPLSARPPYGSDPSLYGIQFLSFGGDEDGEDIKLEFKKRIAEAEILLTDEETWDIVQESVHIFNYMIDIVAELDAICGTTEYTGLEPQKSIQDGNIFQRKRLLVEPQKQQQG
jgi:hypothetical protein